MNSSSPYITAPRDVSMHDVNNVRYDHVSASPNIPDDNDISFSSRKDIGMDPRSQEGL